MIILCLSGIFLFAWLFTQIKENSKKYFVISACILLFLYAALRAHDLHTDIPRYVEWYNKYAKFSFNEIIELFNSEQKDPFYYVFAWCFSRIFPNVQIWLAFVALVYIVSTGILIYKESETPVLSFIAFLALGFFEFSLSGLRQTLAFSLTMLSYYGIKKKNWKLFIFLVLLASLFHRSALIFLIAYPIAHIKLGKYHLFVALAVGLLFFFGQSYIRILMQRYLMDTQYEGYWDRDTSLTMAGFIIQACIFAFCFIYYPATSKKYKSANVLYNLSFIGLVFQLFSSMIAEMFRISMYFSFFNVLLIPMAISVEKESKTKKILLMLVGLAFLVYMFKDGVLPYRFFWE